MENILVLPEARTYFSSNPYIYVESRKLFTELNAFYSQVGKSTMANYLCTQYVSENLHYLNFVASKYISDRGAINIFYEFKRTPRNRMNDINLVDAYFPLVSDYLFVKNCVDPEKIERVKEMVEEVKVCVTFFYM
jgi:hypothetical protein